MDGFEKWDGTTKSIIGLIEMEERLLKNVLTKESSLVILPSLAMKIGFREAIILQQIHYWLTKSLHVIEGRRWVYNTYKEWQKQFPFWSECIH